MPSTLNPISFVATCLAGWLSGHQQRSIDYLIEESCTTLSANIWATTMLNETIKELETG